MIIDYATADTPSLAGFLHFAAIIFFADYYEYFDAVHWPFSLRLFSPLRFRLIFSRYASFIFDLFSTPDIIFVLGHY